MTTKTFNTVFSRFGVQLLIIVLIGFILCLAYLQYFTTVPMETMTNFQKPVVNKSNNTKRDNYMETLKIHEKERHFPFRYLRDEKDNMLPIVLVSGPFRDKIEEARYQEYIDNGIQTVGITAYKSFPRRITDSTGDGYDTENPFDYLGKIKNWLVCFKDLEYYGFNSSHNIIDISESDFYDIEEDTKSTEKKYDMIYVCFKDDDQSCPMDGWNAVNRNYKLAIECLPIIINKFGLKVLVIGRLNCGLEKLYGDKIEIMDFLPYFEFQEKIRESRSLFIPNIYDASPRTVAEALIKDVPVLMNRSIVCGSKYVNYETGELFTDEHDITVSLERLLAKRDKISPKKWWAKNFTKQQMGKKLRDFLYKQYPDILENVEEIQFFY